MTAKLITRCFLMGLCLYGCSTDTVDDTSSLNRIAVLGSHNSYKREIPPALMALIRERNPSRARSIDYHHETLFEQLDGGLRQLEIDVLADAQGGLYSEPFASQYLATAGQPVDRRHGFDRDALRRPGFKVLHVPDIDMFTHCPTFAGCLGQIKSWSDSNPDHLPLFILINIKESPNRIVAGVNPVVFTARQFDDLDAAILSALPRDKLILPDDVRDESPTLRQAVIADRWPRIGQSRGKVLFVFDGSEKQADLYRRGHESLRGRAMFAAVNELQPEAAIMVINDPIAEQARIRQLVARGFIVRTRSDAGMRESAEQMRRRFDAALASGAQIISTDFYPGSPNAKKLNYAVSPRPYTQEH